MEFNVYRGQRVLYKDRGGWTPATLEWASLRPEGLFFDVRNDNETRIPDLRPDQLFTNGKELDEWMKDDDVCIEKEKFAQMIEEGEIVDCDGDAFMSDGDYYYYSVPRLNANWVRKQPLKYVVWFIR